MTFDPQHSPIGRDVSKGLIACDMVFVSALALTIKTVIGLKRRKAVGRASFDNNRTSASLHGSARCVPAARRSSPALVCSFWGAGGW